MVEKMNLKIEIKKLYVGFVKLHKSQGFFSFKIDFYSIKEYLMGPN